MTDPTTAAAYVPWDRVLAGVVICVDCGALVTDQAAHDHFHDRLAETARAANRGDRMSRRIG